MRTPPEPRKSQLFPFLKNFPIGLRRVEPPDAPPLNAIVVGKVGAGRLILCGEDVAGLRPGEEVDAHMAVRNQALEFRTRVLEVSSGTAALVLLAMPEKVNYIDLRKGTRLNVFIPAEVNYRLQAAEPAAPNVSLIPGRMVNLSRKGCCLSTKRLLAIGQPIRVSFELPEASSTYRLSAQVKRHSAGAGDGVFVQGVQFDLGTEHLPVLADLQQWIARNLPYFPQG